MKKVMLLVNKDNVVYNFRRELVFTLLEKGYQVYINSPYGKKIDFLTEKGAVFVPVDIDRRGRNPLRDLHLLWHYYKMLRKIQPDVVLTYTTKCSIYGGIACRMLGIPYIVNNAGLVENNNPFLEGILKILYKKGFQGASCMMYQNGRERDYVNAVLGKEMHYRDIPGSGVNLEEFSYQPYPQEDIIRFNYVARIVGFKGINELLTCAERIKSKYPQTEFVLYGDYDDDSYRQKVQELEKRGVVIYGGIQLDMRPYIAKAHAVIHPSYYEGVTNVVLEHGAMGRPAIASDIPGCREAIDDNVTGYTFPLKDVDALVAKVEEFILMSQERKEEMGRAARRKMEKEFDRDTVTNIYLEEINAIENAVRGK